MTEEPGLRDFNLDELKYKRVEVYANGFRYRGVFYGADEHEVYLKGLTRWWTIPLDRIATLRVIRPPAPLPAVSDEEIAPGLRFEPEESEDP